MNQPNPTYTPDKSRNFGHAIVGYYSDGHRWIPVLVNEDGFLLFKQDPDTAEAIDSFSASIEALVSYVRDAVNQLEITTAENNFTPEERAKLASLPSASDIVVKVTGKDLSTNDYTNADKSKLDSLPSTINLANYVEKEQGKGLSSNDFTSAAKNKLDSLPLATDIVTKVSGKDLSTNDFTTEEKSKLAAVPTPTSIATLDANSKIPIANLPDQFNALETVATYSDLPYYDNYDGRKVMVLDASGDPTVVSGFAIYVYSATATLWTKIAEQESMDLSVVTDWSNITNKPTDLLHGTDIVDDLTSTSTTDVLSAKQGKVLKDLIDALPSSSSSSSVTVDNAMDSLSSNPVENGVIKAYVDSNTISAVAEGTTNGTVKVTKNGTDTDIPVHGLGSAAYTASTDYASSSHNHDSSYAAANHDHNSSYVGSVAEGSTNGTIAVTKNGSTVDVAVHGLGSAAYTASSSYAASSHTHSAVNGYTISVVSSLPASPDNDTIYFIPES